MPGELAGRSVMTELTTQEIVQNLAGLIEDIAEIPASTVTPEASLREDLGIDSLAMIEIVVAATETYGIDIPDDDLRQLRTVQDVVDYVQRTDAEV
jgi:acyl carrier protein